MALAATTTWEIQTGGSDTANGGAFDAGQTAGMLTDGAATGAAGPSPVFTSASYNFVSGDTGAWIYIASGTSWTPGWYKIASVASGAATLGAAAGAAVLANGSPTTTAGCATVTAPTGAIWSIDYSQQATAQFSYSDLASAGAGMAVSSAAKPFGRHQVGNAIVITGGTNFATGIYVIASVSAGTATVVGAGNITSDVGANGAGGLGGALATPGFAVGKAVAGNSIFWRAGDYTLTGSTVNTSGGPLQITVGGAGSAAPFRLQGYQDVRGDKSSTRPRLLVPGAGVTSITLLRITTGSGVAIDNVVFDGAGKASIRGVGVTGGVGHSLVRVTVQNCTDYGMVLQAQCRAVLCEAGNVTGGAAGIYVTRTDILVQLCYVHGCSVPGFSGGPGQFDLCISAGNSIGFEMATGGECFGCTSYNNSSDGFRIDSGACANLAGCIAEANGGYGFNGTDAAAYVYLFSCASFNNTGGRQQFITEDAPAVVLTASAFVAAGVDFGLSAVTGGGRSCRGAGAGSAFTGLATTIGHPDIGAVQHLDSGGSAGSGRLSLSL